jgi:hypothetical protein
MPTPVEVSCLRRGAPGRIEALGGMWQGQPWSLSERELIVAIEQPGRQWDFFVSIDRDKVPIIIRIENGRKHLTAGDQPVALLRLREMPRERALGWEV